MSYRLSIVLVSVLMLVQLALMLYVMDAAWSDPNAWPIFVFATGAIIAALAVVAAYAKD